MSLKAIHTEMYATKGIQQCLKTHNNRVSFCTARDANLLHVVIITATLYNTTFTIIIQVRSLSTNYIVSEAKFSFSYVTFEWIYARIFRNSDFSRLINVSSYVFTVVATKIQVRE